MSTPADAPLNRPIFVIGYMHSGTTLLLQILGAHSSLITSSGETKFFDYLPMFRRVYPNLGDDRTLREFVIFVLDVVRYGYKLGREGANKGTARDIAPEHIDRMVELAKGRREHAAIFPLVFDYVTRLAGKRRWLEKTPTHVLQIDKIVEVVPDALFVEIVRDPRDVLASKKTRRQIVWTTDRYTEEQKPFKNLEKAYDPLWDALSWKSTVRAGIIAHEQYPGRVMTIRYEDLVRAPEESIRAVCRFLDLDFEPAMMDARSRNSAEHGESKKAGISADAVGRFRRALTTAEIALIQQLVRPELERHDYPLDPTGLRDKASMPLLATRSAFEFSQRLSRRFRLGGAMYSANILINYWKRFRKIVHS